MAVRAFSIVVVWFALAVGGAATVDAAEPEPPDPAPPVSFNEFYPDERPLSDCVSSLPKPDCGSEARGEWRQYAVLGGIVAGVGFIAWRVVRGARKAKHDEREPA